MLSFRRDWPLRNYIAALVLAVAIPGLLFSFLLAAGWVRSEQARLEGDARRMTDHVASALERFIQAEIAALQALATSPTLDSGDFGQFEAQARAVAGTHGIGISLHDSTGQQRVSTGPAAGAASRGPAHQAVLTSKQPFVSGLLHDADLPRPVVAVTVPAIRNGQVVFLLTATTAVSRIADLVQETAVLAPYSASVVDRTGLIIARSHESEAYVGTRHPEFAQAQAPRGRWEGRNPQGVPVEGDYRWLSAGWLVTVGLETAALRAPLIRSAWLAGGFALLLTLAGGATTLFVASRVLAAQRALARAAEEVGRGRLIDAPATSVREANDVGEALCAAARRLKDQAAALASANQELERKVEERTQELERQATLSGESEARYRLLSDNTSDIIVRNRLDGTREYVSPACRRVLGYEPEEMVDQEITAIVHPDDQRVLKTEFDAVTSGAEERGTAVYRVRHKRGHWLWIEAHFRAATTEAGEPVVIGTLRDVTQREAQAERLRESEARFRLLADNATDMIVEADLDTTRKYVSPASREILGYEPGELIGTRPLDAVHPDDVEEYRGALSSLTSGKIEVTTSRQRYRRKDGTWVWVEVTFRLIRGSDGEPTGYVASVRDITERQRQSDELQEAKAAAEKALTQAQHANNAKTEFLASMSHEIRTPLNSVIGFTNLLLESSHHLPDVRRKLELIKGSGTALLTIVNDILDFSKIEAGQVELDPITFPLPALVDNVVSIIKGVVPDGRLEIKALIEDDLPTLLVGDANRLQQILLNLMNNAVKFTKAGQVALRVRSEGSDGGTARLRFEVMDTGIGIPKEKLGRLFERFRQVDSSVTRQYGGTGLGLAISRQLIRLMGGEIGVESAEGQGSTFWIRVALPLGNEADLLSGLPVDTALGDDRPARILLVEDLDINQELARLVLESAGHTVDVVGNGAEAIDAVQRGSYDIVLMDIQMPVMDGMTATRHIRSLESAARSLPIIGMTANVLPQQVAEFMQAGMNDHVGKPFKKDDLLAAIGRWMGAQNAASDEAPAKATGASGVSSEAFQNLMAMMGQERAFGMLQRLATQLRARFPDEALAEPDREKLAADAHAIVSMAGMLGFEEISDLCRQIEGSCRAGEDLTEPLGELRKMRDAVLEQIASATSPGSAPPSLHEDLEANVRSP